jgi:pyridoxamine 5'-phosphate oxidase-like protein
VYATGLDETLSMVSALANAAYGTGVASCFVELSKSAPVLTPELIEFVHSGVAVGVATRDESMRPAFTRAWGPHVSADHRSLTLCVSAAEGSATRANLEGNAAVAIGFCPPTIAKAVQLKGVAVVLGEPGPDDLGRVERHVGAFRAECGRIGVPPEVADRMFVGSTLVLISVSIDEGFDQTPGPMAGRRL